MYNYDQVPADLRDMPNWVLWRLEQRNGKTTKPPYQLNGELADKTNRDHLSTFEATAEAHACGRYDGLGFAWMRQDGLLGIDLDNCLADDGTPEDWAQAILDDFQGHAYAEVSQSGRGVKLICRGARPDNFERTRVTVGDDGRRIEVYDGAIYFAMTGKALPGFDTIGEANGSVHKLGERHPKFLGTKPKPEASQPAPSYCGGLTAGEVIESAMRAANGDKFRQLFAGDANYADESTADAALGSLVAFWTGPHDFGTWLEVMRQSALWDIKWTREDYQRMTWELSIDRDEFYEPRQTPPQEKPAEPERKARLVAPYEPFPSLLLPVPLRDFVEAASTAMQCDAAYVALPMLATCAAAIGRTRSLRIKRSWIVPSVLWTAVVAESGTVKTAAFNAAIEPLRRLEQKAAFENQEAEREYRRAYTVYRKAADAWQREKGAMTDPPAEPEPPRFKRHVTQDSTLEALLPILQSNPRGILSGHDELTGFFGGFDKYRKSGNDEAQYLSMYRAGQVIVDRKTAERGTLYVDAAALSICGGVQPDALRRALGNAHIENGLAARFAMAYPPQVEKTWTDDDIPEAIEADYAYIVRRLAELSFAEQPDGTLSPIELRLSPGAKSLWVTWYNGHNKKILDTSGPIRSAWSKLEETPARLAIIFHMVGAVNSVEPVADEITPDEMRSAIAVTKWLRAETFRVYGLLAETSFESVDRKLVEWMRKKGEPVSARDIERACKWAGDSAEIERRLIAIVKAGMAVSETALAESGRGRPSTKYRVTNLGKEAETSEN
jgi:hypothetical protein